MRTKSIIIIALCVLSNAYIFAQSNSVTIDITGFKNDNGKCIIYIHSKKEGFPHKHDNQFSFPISGKECKATIVIDHIGKFALTVLHDENNNDKMDANFIGIPKEGFGASNNAKGNFGPPKFEDAALDYEGKPLKLAIKVNNL